MAPLPRGRGGLPPQASAFLQRARMLDATVRVVAADGYAAATVSAIQARAGVSRRTFYDAFPNKEARGDRGARPGRRATRCRRSWARRPRSAAGRPASTRGCRPTCACSTATATGPRSASSACPLRGRRRWPTATDCGRRWSSGWRRGRRARPAAAGALAALDSALRAGLSDAAKPFVGTAFRGSDAGDRAGAGRSGGATPGGSDRQLRSGCARPRLSGCGRCLTAAEPAGRAELRSVLHRALRDGDGPALLQAVVGWQERRAAGDAARRARCAGGRSRGCEDAWSCGLPLTDVAAGPPGAWLPRSARDRILAWLCEHPDSTAARDRRGRRHRPSLDGPPCAGPARARGPGRAASRTRSRSALAPPRIHLRSLDLPLFLTSVDPTIYGEATSSRKRRRTSKRPLGRSGHERRTPSWAEPTPTRRAPRPCRAGRAAACSTAVARSVGDERRAGRPAAAERRRGADPRARPRVASRAATAASCSAHG